MLLRLLFVVLPLCAGVAIGSQGPTNAMLARYVGPVRATLASVTVSLLTLLIVTSLDRQGGRLSALGDAPRWSLTGGLMGVVVLVGSVLAVPRLGAAATVSLTVAGQLTAAALIDHFGWLGMATRPVDPPRLAGLVLLFAGGVLVARR